MRLSLLMITLTACGSAPVPGAHDVVDPPSGHPRQSWVHPVPGPLWSGLDEDLTLDTGGPPSPNQPPHANAGLDFTAMVGLPVTLSAAASTDPDGDTLTGFAWSLVAAPLGSAATLESAASVEASLVPDVMGVYVVQLRVSDGQQWSRPDLITLIITDRDGTPPDIAGGAP